jgi:DNA-binding NarL/FixJ family response regulator
MSTPVVRVLIVDDFEEWRRELRAILEQKPTLRVVGEAANGREAVQQARLLKPDLILLDIGLPVLNGIEVASLLKDSSLRSKILIVSENRRREIAEEALRRGAFGYVIKSQAGSELLLAVDAVLQGKQFVSSLLRSQDPPANEGIGGSPCREAVVAPFPPRNIATRHEVAFYADDEGLEAGFARISRAVLNVEGRVLVIASQPHRANISRRLQMDGIELESEIRLGKYVQLDAAETLSKIIVDDLPNALRCGQLVNDVVSKNTASANGENRRVVFCGECAPTLLGQGKSEAAVQLEHIWDEVTRTHSADTLCGYVWDTFSDRQMNPVFQRICAEHSAILGRELGY